MAKEPAGATADVKNRLRLGQKPPGELQDGLMDRNKEELLQWAVLVAASPSVEPAQDGT